MLIVYKNTIDFCIFTWYPLILLHSITNVYLIDSLGFSKRSRNFQIKTVLLPPFQSVCLLVPFLALFQWLLVTIATKTTIYNAEEKWQEKSSLPYS